MFVPENKGWNSGPLAMDIPAAGILLAGLGKIFMHYRIKIWAVNLGSILEP